MIACNLLGWHMKKTPESSWRSSRCFGFIQHDELDRTSALRLGLEILWVLRCTEMYWVCSRRDQNLCVFATQHSEGKNGAFLRVKQMVVHKNRNPVYVQLRMPNENSWKGSRHFSGSFQAWEWKWGKERSFNPHSLSPLVGLHDSWHLLFVVFHPQNTWKLPLQ